jgi:hypothetical protein
MIIIEKIKKCAEEYGKGNIINSDEASFYIGATSDISKEYWFEQFQLEEQSGWEQSFNEFYDKYKAITNLPKTDMAATKKYWKALKVKERKLALDNIQKYFDSLNDKKYCKIARTYLSSKAFLNEFVSTSTDWTRNHV